MIAAFDTEVSHITGHAIQELDLSQYMKLADLPPEFRLIGSTPPITKEDSLQPFLAE